ncbi:phosphoribosylamine--glycine ligase [Tessaracoccus flavus]|uniref:Phosphoribosylamine--glycine ligase n=1 Tax=Tessaracoccus flavus TaxID=1610493 RepID=A0A1Q2CCE3_9ACTN|nr:phosphoribosylamine--glycine ligase [Tessaracoccus flavus]AQP43715.1 phosphoribosylamine--glycine ligase [Tessaracoccus flavus]SDZ03424.1 phosphoribosylamine--glycine ligase [Tessaracoccus flavus]
MKILLLGSGGREHAIGRALAHDPAVTELHVAPGNPGLSSIATMHSADPASPTAVLDLARSLQVDLIVIGPEAPLVAGVADALRDAGFDVFGPGREAAVLEGSKAFAKEVMRSAGVPTADARVCETPDEVSAALDEFGPPYVVKNDGLAAGKGVVVTTDRQEALDHAASCGRVVIEDFLDGPEVSLFAICDGERALPLLPAQDYKRVGDDDEGPNTGGMGAYCPLSWADAGLTDQIMSEVVNPTLAEMRRRGTPFIGLLYAGLALTSRGLRVVEFNVRFGDPETQAVLSLLKTPLAGVLRAAARGELDSVPELDWHDGAAVVVVSAAEGYPGTPATGRPITLPDDETDAYVLHAGTRIEGGRLVSSGGRVLGIVGRGADLDEARRLAYALLERIDFAGGFSRTDIGVPH